jgi:hypothetical protein
MDRKDTPHKDFLQPNKHVYVNYLKRSIITTNATEKYTLHYLTNGPPNHFETKKSRAMARDFKYI